MAENIYNIDLMKMRENSSINKKKKKKKKVKQLRMTIVTLRFVLMNVPKKENK